MAGDADAGGTAGTPGEEDLGPPGLQRERTLLAWNRSVLALLVTVALLVRLVGEPYWHPAHLPAVAVGAIAVWLSLAADLRYRRRMVDAPFVSTRHLGALAIAVVTTGVASLVALLAA